MAENDINAIKEEVRRLLGEERSVEALEHIARILDNRSEDPELWELRGVILTRLEKHLAAVRSYDRALDLDPREALLPYLWNNKGISLVRLGLYDDARLLFSQARKQKWRFLPQAHNNLGLTLMKLEQPAGALAEFEEGVKQMRCCLSEDPQRESILPDLLNNRGQAREKLGDLPEALGSYSEAVRLRDGHFPDALWSRGRVFERLGDREKALSDYKAAAAQSPKSPHYELDYVRMLHALGRPEAKRRLRTLLARDPVFAQAAYLLRTEPSNWWEWWFCGMRKHPLRFGWGAFLLILFSSSLVLPLLHFRVPLPINVGKPWHQYALTAVASLLFLLWPHIRRIGKEGIELGPPALPEEQQVPELRPEPYSPSDGGQSA